MGNPDEKSIIDGESFFIYDYYPEFEEGEMITVQSTLSRELRGKFLGWKDYTTKDTGKKLRLELTYKSYILQLALMLDDNGMSLEKFFEHLPKEKYEKLKVTRLHDTIIFKINGKMFKRPNIE